MSKQAGTMYSETERMVSLTTLQNFGLNPIAFWEMMENYIQKVHPLPVKYTYLFHGLDEVMDPRAKDQHKVELWIKAVGNHSSKKWGNVELLDTGFVKLFCQSYYKYARPLPVSFQIMDAIEIHLRTPGQGEFDKKNPLREILPYKK